MRSIFAATVATLVLTASPVFAENGGATDRQSGGISGSQREQRSYDPYLGETRRMMDTGSRSTGYSGGVGDRTGHSAQMRDKAQR